ncbi:11452_t:CDS:2 [Dentiscutata heterogama]|uniref:11452_t:CDS:1 n=1 Tax=Dentiscutata heterogama TaxID=1316150 RepID=A0ACA9LJ55_9GLOM|nr:11452_t:CDS:2 [Dentiscutata heterogama]
MNNVKYVGYSKINLIPRSDVRYVGILNNINFAGSTIPLKQVMSNNRLVPNNNPSPRRGGHLIQQNRIVHGNRRSYNQSYDCNRIQSKFDFEPSNAKSNKDDFVKEVVKITPNHNLQDENYVDSIELGPEEEDDIFAKTYYNKTKSFFATFFVKQRSDWNDRGPVAD